VHGTRWIARAKPNSEIAEAAAGRVRLFLEGLRNSGAFGARSTQEAFFVVCDERIDPPEAGASPETSAGEFRLVIGFAANREHEFHCFRISQSARGAKVQPVSLNRLNFAQYSPAELEWVDNLASQLQS
jgi:phage tail sheath protein FI